jgi:hypothetical protein
MLAVDQDSEVRFDQIVNSLLADWMFARSKVNVSDTINGSVTTVIQECGVKLAMSLRSLFRENREAYMKDGSAESLLGGTKHLYNFVRKTLDVQMLKGMDKDEECADVRLTRIYESFDSGAIIEPLIASLKAANIEL